MLSQVCKLNQSSSSLSKSAAGGGQIYPCPDNLCSCRLRRQQETREGLQRAAEQISGKLGCQGGTELESDFSAKAPHLIVSGIFKVMFSKHTITESPLGRAGCSF